MSPVALERLLRTWQNRLGLNHWRIELDLEKPALEDAYASTWRSDNYDKARVRVEPDWRKWTYEEASEHMVHELLHLQTRDVEQLWNRLDGQLHRDVHEQLDRAFQHEIEGLIDRLARHLVVLAP